MKPSRSAAMRRRHSSKVSFHQGKRADQFRPLCRQNGRDGGAERIADEVDLRCSGRFGYRRHLPGQVSILPGVAL
jgi:hypothetical protein